MPLIARPIVVFLLVTLMSAFSPSQNIEPAASSPAVQQSAAASVPRLIRYSGTIAGARGTIGVSLALYKEQVGGAPLWLETQNVTVDANGRYTVFLGANAAEGLPLDLFSSGEARWLGVKAEGQAEQARTLLVSVPYALKAGDAETLRGLAPSAFLQAAQTSATVSGYMNSSIVTRAAYAISGAVANAIPKFTNTAGDMTSSALFESNGFVGIGTAGPGRVLHIKSPNPDIRLEDTHFANSFWELQQSAYVNDWFGFLRYESNAAVPSKSLIITNTGNFGFGISNAYGNMTEKINIGPGSIRLWGTPGTDGIIFPDGSKQTAPGIGSFNGRTGAVMPAIGDYAFTQVSGTAAKNQLPAATVFSDQTNTGNLAISGKFTGDGSGLTNVAAVTATTSTNALNLNGLGASYYARRDLGNSFTGDQSVSGSAFLTGNLGVGVGSPADKVEVAGNVKLSGALKFGDGSSIQTGLGMVPSGFAIMGTSATAPPGFTQVGWTVVNSQPWTTKAPMLTRRNAAAAGVVNGRIYIIGGCTDTDSTNVVEEYNPATDTWTVKASMPAPRCLAASAVLNGKIYVFGGCQDINCSSLPTAVLEYTPSASGGVGTWVTKGEMPYGAQAPMAVAVGSSIYVMGGATSPNVVFTDAVYEYNPVAGTFTSKAPLPVARMMSAIAVANGKIYLFGGFPPTVAARTDEFDPVNGPNGTWTSKSQMLVPRRAAAAAAVNGFVFVFGGVTDPSSNNYVTTAVEVYSPADNSWMSVPGMHQAKAATSATVTGGLIYITGGYLGGSGSGVTVDTNETFDPSKVIMYLYTRN